MNEAARRGFFCGSKPPYGYQSFKTDILSRSGFKERLVPLPKEAEIVQLVFNLSERGDSGIPFGVKQIAECLNERGILRRGNSWTHTNVHVVLANKVCIGECSWGKRRSRPSPNSAPIISVIVVSILERFVTHSEKHAFPETKTQPRLISAR